MYLFVQTPAFTLLRHGFLVAPWPSEHSCFWKEWFDRKGACQVETPVLQGSQSGDWPQEKPIIERFVGSQLQRYSGDIRCTFEPNMIAQVFPFNCVHQKYSHYLFHQSQWNHILRETDQRLSPDFWKPKHRKSKNYEICLNRLSYQIISLQLLDKLSVRHSGPKLTFKQPPGLWLKQRSSHIL